jgi:hypothetical protein
MILFRRYVDVDLLHPLYTTGYRDRRRGYITANAGFVGPLVGRYGRVEMGFDGVGSWGGSGGFRGRRIIGDERENQAVYEQERADRKRERAVHNNTGDHNIIEWGEAVREEKAEESRRQKGLVHMTKSARANCIDNLHHIILY